ncbi:hypothetical protein [Aneurinibacillus terranovensis]|uniref:hypothetical protein n=1 Tax=Aneurinibacillus terranovensis TaxID=278991 RepID=UPI0004035BB9|nr:hypothetical protein [Aneurinibacillus terranovensis]
MKILQGEHECFYCGKIFIWQANIAGIIPSVVKPRDVIEANIAFIGKNKVEMDLYCPQCKFKNRFTAVFSK